MRIAEFVGSIVAGVFVIGFGWLCYEIKTAPEMYYDDKGNLHRKEWFVENHKTDRMFYDMYQNEHYPYEEMERIGGGVGVT